MRSAGTETEGKRRMTKLQKQREKQGMTQRELARETGICHTHIARIETGERKLGWNAAVSLATVLKCMPAELMA